MAGSEQIGLSGADPDLFAGRGVGADADQRHGPRRLHPPAGCGDRARRRRARPLPAGPRPAGGRGLPRAPPGGRHAHERRRARGGAGRRAAAAGRRGVPRHDPGRRRASGHLARHLRRERRPHRPALGALIERAHRHARPGGRARTGSPSSTCSSGRAWPGATCRPACVRPDYLSELRIPVHDRPGVLAEITSLAADAGISISNFEIAHSVEGPQGILILVVDTADAERLGRRRRDQGLPLARREPGMTAPQILVVTGDVPCRGPVRTPGEKSISHRAVLFAALAEGTSLIRGLSDGADVAASLRAVEAMGVGVERSGDGTVTMHGGRSRLHQPRAPLDCGNSGTSMRLLAGLVAGFAWETELIGDESLSSRPMDRVAEPLELHGGHGGGVGGGVPAAAARQRWGAARHRLDDQGGQCPGQVGHPAGRPLGRGPHRRARAGHDPGPHRGDAARGRGRPDRRAVGGGEDRHAPPVPAASGHPAHGARRSVGLGVLRRGRLRGARQRRRGATGLPGPRPTGLLSASSSGWGRRWRVRTERDGTVSITATNSGGDAPSHRRSPPPRSPPSTRSPPWRWRRRWRRGPPSSSTWPSCGSRRSTASGRWPRW